jgi:hypothetical protein
MVQARRNLAGTNSEGYLLSGSNGLLQKAGDAVADRVAEADANSAEKKISERDWNPSGHNPGAANASLANATNWECV